MKYGEACYNTYIRRNGFVSVSLKRRHNAKDADNKIYDIEIQRADAGADVHRARFHI